MHLPADIFLALIYSLVTYADLSKPAIRANDGGLHLVGPFWEPSISSQKAINTSAPSGVVASTASQSRTSRRHA